MIKVEELRTDGSRKRIGRFATFADAKRHVQSQPYVIIEYDPVYAYCADVFLTDGRTWRIQPEGLNV